MKTKATDRIRLTSGEVTTLGEAIAAGKVRLRQVEHWRRDGRAVTWYLATEPDTGNSWDVNKTLYQSRQGLPVTL